MKNSQAIKSAMQISIGVSDTDLKKYGIDYGLDINLEYSRIYHDKVNAVAAAVLSAALLFTSLSEGGFSISINNEEVKARLRYLAANCGGLFVLPAEFGEKRRVRARRVW